MQTRQAGLEGMGEIRLREMVKQSLRLRPSRLVVGEVMAEECLDLLLALNAGLPGHGDPARELRPQGAGEDVDASLRAGDDSGVLSAFPTARAADPSGRSTWLYFRR
jgi:hypothetical protein